MYDKHAEHLLPYRVSVKRQYSWLWLSVDTGPYRYQKFIYAYNSLLQGWRLLKTVQGRYYKAWFGEGPFTTSEVDRILLVTTGYPIIPVDKLPHRTVKFWDHFDALTDQPPTEEKHYVENT